MAVNYVKFQRGTIAAYNRLSKKDENTLYFIYDNDDTTRGSLYLGDRLISANVGSGSSVGALSDLQDTLITETHTGDFLVQDSSGKWKNVSLEEVINLIKNAETASLLNIDDKQFSFTPVSGELSLKGFSSASANMVPVKGNNNELSWTSLPPDLSGQVTNLETELAKVKTDLEAVDGKILNANHLKYEVIQNLDEALNENTVYLHPSTSQTDNNTYDEFMFVNGSLERLGSFAPDLSQYVTTAQFNSTVGNLDELLSYRDNPNEEFTLVDSVKDIYERLVWQEMAE